MKNISLKRYGGFVFSFIAVVFGLWSFYEYKKAEKETIKKAEAERFLNKKLKELKAFRIKKKGETLSARKKEGDNWILTQPVRDQAEWTEISRWMDEITNQKVQQIEDLNDINWEDWHLSDKAPSVEMDFEDNSAISFSVSEKSSFDGKYFIKKGNRLFIGEKYFHLETGAKDFELFRRKKLMPPGVGHASKIQFHGKKGFTLLWRNYKWSLEGASEKSLPLDSHRLDSWWTDISSLKAVSIKEKAENSSLRKYSLTRPRLKITFHSAIGENKGETEGEYSLRLSPIKEGRAFVALSHRDFIFELSKEDAGLLPLSRHDILNHSFPFDYEKSHASRVEIISGGSSTVSLKKENGVWAPVVSSSSSENQPLPSSKKPEKPPALSTEKVEDFLNKIRELKGEKYTSPKKALKPNRSIEIKNEEGETIFLLEDLPVSSGSSYARLRTNLWHELIDTPKPSIDEIFAFDFFSSMPEKPAPLKPLPEEKHFH